MTDLDNDNIRLDKWLWAARFFKTRVLATTAINNGKIHYNDARVKPSKIIHVGALIRMHVGADEKIIRVLALSSHRGTAPQATMRYEETPESILAREQSAVARKLNTTLAPDSKPNKKQRRQLHSFKQQPF